MKVGLLTGGGDAPGLNSVIETCVRTLSLKGIEVLGIRDGFEGLLQGRWERLSPSQVLGCHALAGTYLGASNESSLLGREDEVLKRFQEMQVQGLLVCGGDGTFSALKKLSPQIPIIGLPKTIDNDIEGTDMSFGFDTACEVILQSVEALRTTAEAHHRIFLIETMGRTTGWLALRAGLAAYADFILIPEKPFSKQALKNFVLQKKQQGQRSLMGVVSEGAFASGESETVAFQIAGSPKKERLGGVTQELARWLEKETGWSTRNMVLGHLQRAQSPSVADQILTRELSLKACELVQSHQWNQAVVIQNGQVTHQDLSVFTQGTRQVPLHHPWIQKAEPLGIFI